MLQTLLHSVFKMTAGLRTNFIKYEAGPAKVPSKLVLMSANFLEKNISSLKNTLSSSKIFIAQPTFAKLPDRMSSKIKLSLSHLIYLILS